MGEDDMAFFAAMSEPTEVETWRDVLLQEDNELTRKYWSHRQHLHGVVLQQIRKRKYSDQRQLLDDEWKYLSDQTEIQLVKCDNMLWWMVWKCFHSDTLKSFGWPITQKDFCRQILDCSPNQPRQWRRTWTWLDQYLSNQSFVGKDILKQYEDSHFHITGIEGMRRDKVGLDNRRFAAELTGTLVKRADVTSGGEKVEAIFDVSGLNDLLGDVYGSDAKTDESD